MYGKNEKWSYFSISMVCKSRIGLTKYLHQEPGERTDFEVCRERSRQNRMENKETSDVCNFKDFFDICSESKKVKQKTAFMELADFFFSLSPTFAVVTCKNRDSSLREISVLVVFLKGSRSLSAQAHVCRRIQRGRV